jgi:hypothetical protein
MAISGRHDAADLVSGDLKKISSNIDRKKRNSSCVESERILLSPSPRSSPTGGEEEKGTPHPAQISAGQQKLTYFTFARRARDRDVPSHSPEGGEGNYLSEI